MKKVLFVCTANVCRSPMAAAIFNALAEDRDLPFRAESTGVAALEDELGKLRKRCAPAPWRTSPTCVMSHSSSFFPPPKLKLSFV